MFADSSLFISRDRQRRFSNFVSQFAWRRLATIALAAIIGAVLASIAAAAPPVYQLQFLGNGSPTGLNNNGIVIGARLSGNNYTPLVSVDGAPWTELPAPVGAMSTFPTDINNSNVIVGVSFDTSWNPVAVRWTRSKSTFTIEILPRLAGNASSYALGINDLGQIVGARSSLGYSPTGTGWLYSDALGVFDLTTFGFWVYPRAINGAGLIIGGQERLNFATGQVDVIGQGPTNYNPVGGVAINNSGQIAGTASLRSTSLNIVSLFRYEGATGWRMITGTSRYTTASSINNLGDIGFSELGAGIYLNNDTFYAVGELLDPAVRNNGWTITGTGVHVNDNRSIATIGRNSVSGENGAVLLTANGDLPPPTAPANLNGTAHPATRMEPFNSINLSWENTSVQTRSFDLQRRDVSGTDWTALSLIPPASGLTHVDATVGLGITYEYRVRAVGVSGPGPWSASVFVTSPSTPLDTTPPTVSILNPTDGANVSGIVPVAAQANDDVAVEYFEVSFWNQFMGQEVIIGSMTSAGTLNVNWDTRNLTPAAYRLRAFAYDTLGNWTTRDVTVNVGGTTTGVLRSASITLSASGRNTVFVNGRVNVRDGFGEAVRAAVVTVEWTLPNGQTEIETASTGANGNAGFATEGRRGSYSLRVTGITKSGYSFDPANSVLTKSITR